MLIRFSFISQLHLKQWLALDRLCRYKFHCSNVLRLVYSKTVYHGLAAFNPFSFRMLSIKDAEIIVCFFINILMIIAYESHVSLHVSMMSVIIY